MTDAAAILRDLARARAACQLRTIEAVMREGDSRCAHGYAPPERCPYPPCKESDDG